MAEAVAEWAVEELRPEDTRSARELVQRCTEFHLHRPLAALVDMGYGRSDAALPERSVEHPGAALEGRPRETTRRSGTVEREPAERKPKERKSAKRESAERRRREQLGRLQAEAPQPPPYGRDLDGRPAAPWSWDEVWPGTD